MITFLLSDVARIVNGQLTDRRHENVACNGIALDSREIRRGEVFVAIRGTSKDGHAFITEAAESGASACIVEDPSSLGEQPGIVVSNARLAVSSLASAFNSDPSSKLHVIGITGTNGKTTTNWITYHLLNRSGLGAVRMGTLGVEILGRDPREGMLTSPDPVSLHTTLAQAAQSGAQAAVMEVSSHALDQLRVEHIQFDCAVFCNLSRDHLDYHGTEEAYFTAKKRLFSLLENSLKRTKGSIINLDDPHGYALWRESRSAPLNDWSFGRNAAAAVRIVATEERAAGIQLSLHIKPLGRSMSVTIPYIGQHNAENVTAAIASVLPLGVDIDAIKEYVVSIPQVPGRLERVGMEGPRVFVDFAHTPDAIERALAAVRPSTKGKLWVVFGCGGDRDRGKRPEMGRVAARLADHVVVTSDNPRTEDPNAIISDILAGGIEPDLVEADRRAAITSAIREARPDDTIVIAGKGHENYQIIGREKFPFSDQVVAGKVLSERVRG